MTHLTTLFAFTLFTCSCCKCYNVILVHVLTLYADGAQTSLYFPGFDPQPLSVDFVSTDSQGHTVWVVHGTQDASGNGGFPGASKLPTE